MEVRIKVMGGMITVVETVTISLKPHDSQRLGSWIPKADVQTDWMTHPRINYCNDGANIQIGILPVNKGMLTPVAHHGEEPKLHKWQYKDKGGCSCIDMAQEEIDRKKIYIFPKRYLERD